MENNRKKLLIIIGSLLILTIGITYAYYEALVHGTGNTNATAGANTANLGEIEFNGTSTFDSTTFDEIYPGFIGIQEFTIEPHTDGSGVYEIDVEAIVPYAFSNDIKLIVYKTSDSSNNYITRTEGTLTQNNYGFYKQDNLNTTGTLTKVYEGILLTTEEEMIEQVEFSITNGSFTAPTTTPDGYYTYYAVYEYISRDTSQNNQQGLNFSSKITVKYVAEKVYTARDTLAKLNSLNSNITLNNTTPDFSLYAPRNANVQGDGKPAQESGLFISEDDYGTSYYFRGDIEYNYVKFGTWQTDSYTKNTYHTGEMGYVEHTYFSLAECEEYTGYTNEDVCVKHASQGDDMYWRIIRINGDGSIRMIYDHSANQNNINQEGIIGYSTFDDNEYYSYNYYTNMVGYMHGDDEEKTVYENTYDSGAKEVLDSWYEKNISHTSYDNYVSDRLFCNDRSIASETIVNYANANWGLGTFVRERGGYDMNNIIFGPLGRITEQNEMKLGNKVTLKCPNKSDAFTVGDTTKGNGALTYPVGLITIDELSMAGFTEEYPNPLNNNYLCGYLDYECSNDATIAFYYTMSPAMYNNNPMEHSQSGHAIGFSSASDSGRIRPVININPAAINTGSGTAQDPFKF